MKRIICLFGFLPSMAFAVELYTSCPSGYVSVDAPAITIATTCPSDRVSVGVADSCLVSSPSMDCVMYAPVGISYTDDYGTYEYTEPCAMTN